MSKGRVHVADGLGRKNRMLSNNMQNEVVQGVRSKEGVVLPDARRVRYAVVDGTHFLLHNAHVSSGKEPPKDCFVCQGRLAKMVRVVEQVVPAKPVGKSVGADTEETTASTPDSKFWPWD